MLDFHDIVLGLQVVDAVGTPKAVLDAPVAWADPSIATSGKVVLAGGVGFQLETDPETNAIEINADVSAGAHDPFYLAKFNKLVGGGCYLDGCASTSGGLTPPSYVFSGGPYYISTINDLRPFNTARDRNFAVMGGACMQVGDFTETTCSPNHVPTLAYPDVSAATLKLFNMCTPDVDCEDYRRIFVYLEEIRKKLDGNKDNNLTTGIKLFKQYEATIHYWNFMVMNKGFTFDVVGGVSQIALVTGYEAVACGTYSGVAWTIGISQVRAPSSSSPEPVATMEHNARSFKASRSDLRPVATGGNPMTVTVPASMKTRDYVLQNSVVQLSVPKGASPSTSGDSTASGASGDSGGSSASSEVFYPIEFAITVEWNEHTHIGSVASLTKNIIVMVREEPATSSSSAPASESSSSGGP